jgi:hypothetical protein
MTVALPIELYFTSENGSDFAATDQCLTVDATVREEGKTMKGLAGIKAWRMDAAQKYQHTVVPLAVTTRDGKVVVSGKVSGNFPDSPITLDHTFELAGDPILSLVIGYGEGTSFEGAAQGGLMDAAPW